MLFPEFDVSLDALRALQLTRVRAALLGLGYAYRRLGFDPRPRT